MGTLKLVNTRNIKVEEGWGVDVTPIFSDEQDDSHVADIDVTVVQITKDNLEKIGGVWCVKLGENYHVPVESFKHLDKLWQDDTHDLRTRWFATEQEARDHAEYTLSRWKNPNPWESFVCLS